MAEYPIVELTTKGSKPLRVVIDRAVEVGRECDGLLVADPLVSRRHLRIEPTGDGVTVSDLGSSNGTKLNGQPLTGSHQLQEGDVIEIGAVRIELAALAAVTRARKPRPMTGPRSRDTVIGGPTLAEVTPPTPPTPPGTPAPPTAAVPAAANDAPITTPIRTRSVIERIAQEVSDDRTTRISIAGTAPSGGTLTFAFSDIASSTEMAQAMGDQKWFVALSAHNRLIEHEVRAHSGRIVKAIGDGFMFTFTSARQAALCAIAIQRSLRDATGPVAETGIRVRIGLHTGEAIESGGDLLGIHVNAAARIAALAGGGEITVSAVTRAITSASGDLRFGPEEQAALKGIPGTTGVSRLIWEDPTV